MKGASWASWRSAAELIHDYGPDDHLDSRYLGSFRLGPNDVNQGIYTGDARELINEIPNESVDVIFTDPIYDRIEDYQWLADVATRILKPNRPCLAWCSKVKLPKCQDVMALNLDYLTTLFYTVLCKNARPAFQIGIISWTTPCLVFGRGIYKCDPFLPDTFIASKGPQTRFKWNKNTPVHERWLRSFSKAGDVVLDPFCGEGAVPAAAKRTGRRWLAFEIEPSTAEKARDRVCQTQPLMPGWEDMMEQLEIGFEGVN